MMIYTLREARKKRQLTQAGLFVLSGISQVAISKLETGATKEPKMSTVRKLAKALRLTPAQLQFDGSTE